MTTNLNQVCPFVEFEPPHLTKESADAISHRIGTRAKHAGESHEAIVAGVAEDLASNLPKELDSEQLMETSRGLAKQIGYLSLEEGIQTAYAEMTHEDEAVAAV